MHIRGLTPFSCKEKGVWNIKGGNTTKSPKGITVNGTSCLALIANHHPGSNKVIAFCNYLRR